MSSDTQYEFADDFEQFFLAAGDLQDKNSKKCLKQNEIGELNEICHKMDHCCNQMDLEASLMPEEELGTITIHKACRTNYNEIRKKIRQVEESYYKLSKKNSNPKKEHEYTSTIDVSISAGVQINDLDSTRQSIQSMDTLRNKYGMTNQFGDNKDHQVTEQLITDRDNRIFHRRVFYISAIVVLQMVAYWCIDFFFSSNTDSSQPNSDIKN